MMSTVTSQPSAELLAGVRRQLDRIRWRRNINSATRAGDSAQTIADRLGDDVDTITAEIRKIDRRPNILVRTPKELIYEYAVGERTRDSLISTLSTWPYTFGRLGVTPGHEPQSSDAWDRGTWDDVESARASHLIDDDTYAQIARAADLPATVFPQWVNGHTRKDPAA